MKIISIKAKNFGSYREIDFNFSGKGLYLISGPTGSGKSTLCDLVPWTLFGKTAKNGAADEVKSWGAEEQTEVTVILELGSNDVIRIVRKRGPNDLVLSKKTGTSNWTEVRGKDLNDTQKLINQALGFDSDLYLSGAYFHEFCQSAQFFVTSAKNRRQITEQLVDLSLAVDLQEASRIQLKQLASLTQQYTTEQGKLQVKVDMLSDQFEREGESVAKFEIQREVEIKARMRDYESFESNREESISYLKQKSENWIELQEVSDGTCPTCGSSGYHKPHVTANPYLPLMDKELRKVNTYLEQVNEIMAKKNPYLNTGVEASLGHNFNKLNETNDKLLALKEETADLELLQQVVQDFRGVIVKNSIHFLEQNTNKLLNDHFDAEIRVLFSIEDADKLEVSIFKDGNDCTYTQLSKGQRQLLKLCFGIAVMKAVSNQHGVHFNQIFLDEPTDGCDENFKTKAVQLFESLALEHDTVFIVEHSPAIKALVSNHIVVALENGESSLEEA